MLWKEFKASVERQGINDETIIDHIDWRFGDPVVATISTRDKNLKLMCIRDEPEEFDDDDIDEEENEDEWDDEEDLGEDE